MKFKNLVYQSQAFKKTFKQLKIFFKHPKIFSSIFMQVRAKRDLYDTSWMILFLQETFNLDFDYFRDRFSQCSLKTKK